MEKKTDSLLFKFAIIFAVFTVITLVISGLLTYRSQMISYRQECMNSIREVGAYLENLIVADGDDFALYQDYYMENFQNEHIPMDFTESVTAQEKFESLFSTRYPGKILGKDIQLSEVDDEVRHAYFAYTHEYWLLTFEHAREAFNLPYTYYLVMKEDVHDSVYMIDGERTEDENHPGTLYLGDEYFEDPAERHVIWNTWYTGERQDEFMVWDNQWGHTYGYYTPLWINGRKMGLITTEIDVARVNQGILRNTLTQLAWISLVLIICMIAMLVFINKRYISKLSQLQSNVKTYSLAKDANIAGTIEKAASGRDEISSLGNQIAAMILELENYMNSLVATSKELSETKQHANEMHELANKDALTGVRNKTAYDNEVRRVEWKIQDGYKDFGIAMIDLNFLKRINDTYGHEQGNIAIKKLCHIVCTIFEHSPVFRIGGDEFVVILENDDYKNYANLVKEFNSTVEWLSADDSLEQWERISAAIGVAIYDPIKDSSVDNVFKRADKAMYARKKEMKAVRTV